MSTGAQSELGFMAPPVVKTWRNRALIAGIVFAVPSIIGWVLDTDQFYRSYLLGYMWCFELTVGSMALLMLYHLTGGAWGTVLRRIMEAAMQNIWLMLPLFAPIVIGIHHLYPWSRPAYLAYDDHVRAISHEYLNIWLWLGRAGLYFIVFIMLVWALMAFSRRQDREPEVSMASALRAVSGPGAVVYLFMTLFLYTDWLMSLTPDWFSMIYALIFNAGHGLAAISFAVVIADLLVRYQPMKTVMQPDQFLDQGKIMLTFVMMWGWWSYAQWIIFWSGNKPDEISWYIARTRGGWGVYGFALIMVYLVIPFALLLSRSFKSNSHKLAKLALLTLFARYMDNFWFIGPSFPDTAGHFHFSWLNAVVPICLGGFWLALFFQHLKARPLLALQDPHVDLVLEQAYGSEQ